MIRARLDLDFRGRRCPAGVAIGTAPRVGAALFARKRFAATAIVYRFDLRLMPRRFDARALTDRGELSLAASTGHGTPLAWPFLVDDLDALSHLEHLLDVERAGDHWQRAARVIAAISAARVGATFASFDELLNHSDDPNTHVDLESPRDTKDVHGRVVRFARRALREIDAGEELTADYRSFIPSFRVPSTWR